MSGFPHVDPIPLPAPVWLFKLLHILTLSLHFAAMQVLVGALLIAVLLDLLGRTRASHTAATAIGRRLPIVMTYVINLGVPPLLFAQVLYGRALYTSSVLIGAYWIGVIPALVLAYWLLYRFAAGLEAGKKVWWVGLLAWIVIGGVADIYVNNMTLMLRPEAWQKMYSASTLGTHLPQGDPTVLPRFLFFMTGGFVAAAMWLIYLAGRKTFNLSDGKYLSALGGKLAFVAGVAQVIAAIFVYRTQPSIVRAGLNAHPLYRFTGILWLALAVIVIFFGLLSALKKPTTNVFSWSAAVITFLAIASMTIYRDGVRDITLLSKGFDVWQRAVATNWSVVGIFLVLFVGGLGVIAWLISVVAKATRVMESEVQI